MKSFTTSDIHLWVLAAGISLSMMSGASFAQQPNAAALPKVESANIMDIGRAADASPQAQIEAAKNQPGNNSPVWRTVNSDTPNFVNGPVTERGVLIQKSGQQWRLIRNGVITVFGAWILAFAFFGVLAMYTLRGPIKLHEPLSGTKIKRFTDLERYTHWTMAFSFVALAFTGLLILYGKFFALPVMGGTLFGIFLFICKNIHNFVGPLFTLSIIVFFFLFVRKNMLEPDDMAWIKSFGGLLSGKHVPSGFFNFGEKFWFWFGMVFLGLIISASGWVLDMIVPVPGIEYWRGTMQVADIIHASAALLMTAMAMGHIYIGTIGMQGSIDGMKTGYVDATWAKEHHEVWYNKVK